MKREIVFEKVVKFKALEFDNFYYINNQIKLKKQLDALGIDVSKLEYDKAINIAIPSYSILDKKEVTHVSEMEINWRGHAELKKGETFWVEKCYGPEKPYTVAQLAAADKDIDNSLAWFCGYDHSLWDTNMQRLSTPLVMNYIDGGINNERYKLKALIKHIKSIPSSFIAELGITDIHDIPGYKSTETCNRTFDVQILLTQEKFNELMSSVPHTEKHKEFTLHHKLGYYMCNSFAKREALKKMLGFAAFEKPEVKDEDD